MEVQLKIENWLKNNEFEAGLKLYEKHGNNQVWKGLLKSMGKTSVTEKKLIELMKVLLEELKAASQQVQYVQVFSVKKQTLVKEVKLRRSESPDAPQPVQKLIAERKSLWREAYAWFIKLEYLLTNEERLSAARIINHNWRRISRIWVMTMEFDETGMLPPEPVKGTIVAKDINSMHKLLCGLRSKKSKIKAGRLRQFSVENPEIDILAQVEADIDELEHLIELSEIDYEFIQE
jgi:hypothetical protein